MQKKANVEDSENDLEQLKRDTLSMSASKVPELVECVSELKDELSSLRSMVEDLSQKQNDLGDIKGNIGEIQDLKTCSAELLKMLEPVKQYQKDIEERQNAIETAEEKGQVLVADCISICKQMDLRLKDLESRVSFVNESTREIHKFASSAISLDERFSSSVSSYVSDLNNAKEKARQYLNQLTEEKEENRKLWSELQEIKNGLKKKHII